jgi:hypothetical protein
MAPKPKADSVQPFAAGDRVEVTDPTSKQYGKVGVILFFVVDNVYVQFPGLRWIKTRMFFPDQLRPADPFK